MKKITLFSFTLFYIIIASCFNHIYSQSQYSWKALPNAPMVTGRFDDMFFTNALTGWIIQGTNSNDNLYKTTDGGITWDNISDSSLWYPRCIGFANSSTGWIGTYIGMWPNLLPGIFKTTDGGQTWEDQFENIGDTTMGICGLSIVNENYVFACGRWYEPSRFYKTTNGGDNWVIKDMTPYVTRLIDCYFTSPDSGFVIGGVGSPTDSSKGVVLFTSDGGDTWVNRATTNNKGQFGWKISFPTKNIGYISLEKLNSIGSSYILKTTDGGQTWDEKIVLQSTALDQEGIGFIDENTGWLGGWGFYNYKTTNGGENWTQDTWGFNVNRFRFINDTLAYAVGQTVYKYERDTTVGITNTGSEIPVEYELSQNYPNPFNPATTIRFHVLDYEDTRLTIFDALGREVSVLVNERLKPGVYEYTFDATGLQSGVYFYKIETLRYTETKKMILLK